MKNNRPEQPAGYQSIDVPFEFRHTCWFCGEPYYESHSFMATPNYEHQALPILVPCCQECFSLCQSVKASGLDLLRDKVKEKLHRKYEKHLQIGANWTKQELDESEFEGKALEGFRESAWEMFEIAKQRVNYTGWPLTVDGLPVMESSSRFHVEFNGIRYTSLAQAVEQLAKAYSIPQPYLEEVVEVVGRDRLSYAIRFAKATYGYSPEQREASIGSLKAMQAEETTLSHQEKSPAKGIEVAVSDIHELILSRTMISSYAIQWILKQGIRTLDQLAAHEEAFFEHFMQDSEVVAFTYFNAVQIYLEKREQDPSWAENDDPNRGLFARLV